jgi:hypothetical protein
MTAFSWYCPFCKQTTTIVDSNIRESNFDLDIKNITGYVRLKSTYIVCPNTDCGKFTLKTQLYSTKYDQQWGRYVNNQILNQWDLIPRSKAKIFPTYVPTLIRQDYEEACLILNDSPKASATLSRRCLQGMIRDFWGISKNRLIDEINAIKDKVDPLIWDSIEAVRKIGNIGAHMEKDINIIIDVEPHEAELLLQLIELLVDEWYIAKHERQLKLQKIIDVSNSKSEKKEVTKK